ncbi:translesion error-prone DNA polymerase V subunit UmuC [Nitrincola iocasae]|uniref:Translesion error-prone DNA polymerase V subunit UmuC n=1 Tax=Nitrincola iocasae TaxID=2614693 RepID=A0A5J6LFN9_9GAMM|nr:translesion error-prone DNA polymerase V subunit UmuC [Nitrincola iocasae]QEW07377.1 translesion error-prone DNA polymerase V subunit UmuC [Nitrincola iocasae]
MPERPAVFALVDCNNFYASCEKLFRPDLKHQPVVVLSNNDGCVVARSREAKELGIKMGVPAYQVQELIRQHGITVFSSNYALYADLSARVMSILESLAPRVEIYSIDEAFLDLTGVDHLLSLEDFGKQLRKTVYQCTGISVCVGMAPTKTLAKLANHAAKHYPATGGVVNLTYPGRQRKLMALLPVDEVWGIGRRLSRRLKAEGIQTVLDLANAPPKQIRRHYSVVVERTVRELNGESCLDLDSISPTKKQIICSRSFGERITEFKPMREAISEYTVRAAEKLRREQRRAKVLTLFLRTNRFNPSEQQYTPSLTTELHLPTDDTRDLVAAAVRLLNSAWREGYRYMKAGVMLSDFYEPGTFQPSLFEEYRSHANAEALMSVLDTINHSGKGRVFFAVQGTKKDWKMKRENLSPAYTTCWKDLPWVK